MGIAHNDQASVSQDEQTVSDDEQHISTDQSHGLVHAVDAGQHRMNRASRLIPAGAGRTVTS